MIVRTEPDTTPIPDVVGTVVEAEAVGIEFVDQRGLKKSIIASIMIWKITLPNITAVLKIEMQFVILGIAALFEAAASSILSLCLSWESPACPFSVGLCIVSGDVRDRVFQ
jgi:hypothetical protein